MATVVVMVMRTVMEGVEEVDPQHSTLDFTILGSTHHFSLTQELSRDYIVKHTLSEMCRNSERSLQTSLAMLRRANEAVPHIEGLDNEGLSFVTAGAAVNIVRCAKVTVAYDPRPSSRHRRPPCW